MNAPTCFRRAKPVRVLVAFLAIVAAVPLTTAIEPGSTSWCPIMSVVATGDPAPSEGSDPVRALQLRVAQYDVDVVGSTAIGSLTLEFYNATNEERRVRFSDSTPRGLEVESARLQVGNVEADSLELPATDARTISATSNPPRRIEQVALPRVGTQPAVPTGGTVTVETRFRMNVPFREGRFRLLLPAMRGECGGPAPSEAGFTLSARVRIRSDRELTSVDSPTHAVNISSERHDTVVELAADPIGAKPFGVDFALGRSAEPALAAFASPAVDGERELVVVLSPAVGTSREAVRAKELLLVLDTSGSMYGEKIAKAVSALSACLDKVAPQDRFNIIRFSYEFALLHPDPVEGTPVAVAEAQRWLSQQRTGGNTKLLPALRAVLEQKHDPGRHRLIVIVSDGKLGDAAEVESFLKAQLGEARLFLVGIGADADEQGLIHLAQLGRGTAVIARTAEKIEGAIAELFGSITAPVAWDLRLDFGSAELVSMEPRQIPDLYAGRPVTVRARLRGELPPDVLVKASTTDGAQVFESKIAAAEATELRPIQRRAE